MQGTLLTQAEADHYGDPALRYKRPIIWANGVPHHIRGISQTTPKIGDVLLLCIKGRHGSRILLNKIDSFLVSEQLRAGHKSIKVGNLQSA